MAAATILGIIITTCLIIEMIQSNELPPITLIYIVRIILGTLGTILVLVPDVTLIDLLIVKSVTLLFKEFKNADKSGKICLIIGFILVLFQQIGS